MHYLRQELCPLFPWQNHFISYNSNGTLCLVLTSWALNSSKVYFSRFLTSQLYSMSHREVISFALYEIICKTSPPSISRQITFWKCDYFTSPFFFQFGSFYSKIFKQVINRLVTIYLLTKLPPLWPEPREIQLNSMNDQLQPQRVEVKSLISPVVGN